MATTTNPGPAGRAADGEDDATAGAAGRSDGRRQGPPGPAGGHPGDTHPGDGHHGEAHHDAVASRDDERRNPRDDDRGSVSRLGDAVALGIATAGQDRRWQPRLALTLALGLAGGFLLAEVLGAVVGRVRGLLVSVAVALFISFALEPAVKWMHDRGMSRGAATGILFGLTVVSVVGFFAAMVPLIVDQATTLFEAAPQLIDGLRQQAQNLPGPFGERAVEWLQGVEENLPSQLPAIAGRAGRNVVNVGASVLGQVFNLLTIGLVAFYAAADGPKLRRVLSSHMQPTAQREFLEVWEIAIDKTGGYLYSRVITAVVSAVFHTVVFMVIGLDYAFALGIWVGVVSSVVPVVGTYLAGFLPILIALASSVGDAAWVLAAIVTYQQVENYLIAPRVTAHTVSLHPAVAFLAVVGGAALLGAFGALLAIPVAAIISALWTARRERHDVVDHQLTSGPPVTAPWLQRRP